MQEFGSKIGWARMGLLVSAVLLAVMGVLCFTAHGILPEALHTPNIPEGYTWPVGEIIGIVVMLVVAVCQFAAYAKANGSRNLSGWIVLPGIMSLVCALAGIVDPYLGTFCFEWVIAVFIAFVGIAVLLGAVTGGRTVGYKGWTLEVVLSLVMIVLALGVVYDSALSSTMAGLAFFVYAVVVALEATMGQNVKLAA